MMTSETCRTDGRPAPPRTVTVFFPADGRRKFWLWFGELSLLLWPAILGGLSCLGVLWLNTPTVAAQAAPPAPALGLPSVPHPATNPPTAEKIELGKLLYFDKRLSVDNSLSCASCHDPEKGWSNGEATAVGFGGQRGGRSSPTIINSAYNRFQFWDGRAGSLEEQALGPIANPIEMNLPLEALIQKLKGIDGYQKKFQSVFQGEITQERVAQAIATFERTILSGDSPYDRFKAGNSEALTTQQQQGMKLFFGKANCSSCHSGSHFSDNAFHNLGLGMHGDAIDKGRFEQSKLLGDTGAFKTPTLRDVGRTAPYMHDGSLATLEDVVAYYAKGGTPNAYLDEEIFAFQLTDEEKQALVAFVRDGLASTNYPSVTPPTEFPQ